MKTLSFQIREIYNRHIFNNNTWFFSNFVCSPLMILAQCLTIQSCQSLKIVIFYTQRKLKWNDFWWLQRVIQIREKMYCSEYVNSNKDEDNKVLNNVSLFWGSKLNSPSSSWNMKHPNRMSRDMCPTEWRNVRILGVCCSVHSTKRLFSIVQIG